MPTFELRFFTNFDDGLDHRKEHVNSVSRHIIAQDLADAKTIGEAMLGEEVWSQECLSDLLSVETAKGGAENEQGYWDDGTITWERVFHALKIEKSNVDFIRNPRGVIVGFRKHDVS